MAETLRRLRAAIGVLVVTVLLPLAGVSALAPATAAADDIGTQVVGGTGARIADYPWTMYLATASGFQYCGGTLVAPNKVVTAAHCTVGDSPSAVRVVAGREDKRSTAGVVARVTRIWIHPGFRDVTQGEDVSVLTLDRNLPYATLPFASPSDSALYAPGTQALVLGWGTTREGGNASRYLRKATVPVTSDSYCGGAYRESEAFSMVCAG